MMMGARFPLSAKIVLWFFANLLLVGAAVYAFVEFEFHLGPESLVGGRAGRRAEGLANLVGADIRVLAPEQWDGVLARAGNLYGLKLIIAGPDGRHIAGAEIALPREVVGQLFRPMHPRPPIRDAPPPLSADAAAQLPPPGHRMIHT